MILFTTFSLLFCIQPLLAFQYNPFCTQDNGTKWSQGPFKFWCQKEPNKIGGNVILTDCFQAADTYADPPFYKPRCSKTTDGIEILYDSCSNTTCPVPLTTARNTHIACLPGVDMSVGHTWQWETSERGIYSHGYGKFRVLCTVNSDNLKSEVVSCVDEKGEVLTNGAEWVEGKTTYPDGSFVKKCLIDSHGGKIYIHACVQPKETMEVRENNSIWRSSDKKQLVTCKISAGGTESSDVYTLPINLQPNERISEDLRTIVDENEATVACLSLNGQRKENGEKWEEGGILTKCEIGATGKFVTLQTTVCGDAGCSSVTAGSRKLDQPLPTEKTVTETAATKSKTAVVGGAAAVKEIETQENSCISRMRLKTVGVYFLFLCTFCCFILTCIYDEM